MTSLKYFYLSTHPYLNNYVKSLPLLKWHAFKVQTTVAFLHIVLKNLYNSTIEFFLHFIQIAPTEIYDYFHLCNRAKSFIGLLRTKENNNPGSLFFFN